MRPRDIAKKIPFAVPAVRALRNMSAIVNDGLKRRIRRDYCGNIFSNIYRSNYWGNQESVSGVGSTAEATQILRAQLPEWFRKYTIKSLVDAPCGDFVWMRHVVGNLESYFGLDVVPELIERNARAYAADGVRFAVADITRDDLPEGDALLCRDCLIHLSSPLVMNALQNFRRTGYTYILLTHDAKVTAYREIVTGDWRPINWTLPPFMFPPPKDQIAEDSERGRFLAIWETRDLPLYG